MRIVVKIGSSTLAHPTGRMNIRRAERKAKVRPLPVPEDRKKQ